MRKIKSVISPFLWAIKISWQTNWLLFSTTSASTLITSSVSGIINTFLVAQTTASVAQLASGQVTVRTPIMWAIAFGLFNILTDVIRRITNYYDSKFAEQLDIVISGKYVSKVSSFTQEQLDTPSLQTSLSMAGRELYSVRRASSTLQEIISSFFAYLLAVIVVWQYAWGIGLLLLVLIPILAVSNYFQTKRRRISWEESTIHWRIASGLFNYLTDPLRLFEIKIMGARQKIMKLRNHHVKEETKIRLEAEKKNAIFSIFEDISSPLIEMGTRIWAIMLVAGGQLAFDQFLFVIGLIQQASSQTFILGYSISNAQETYLATSSLRNVINIPDAPNGKTKLPKNEKGVAIALDKVELKYPNGTTAIKDISIDIKPGQKVAIVGENGAGKTSILRLLTRQYEPTSGELLLQGVNSSDIERSSLYSQISILSQDFYLFDDLTIKQNLEIADAGKISQQDIEKTLDMVHLTAKINSLDKKLDTRLDKSYDDGSDLSGGQKQRLSIARALLKPYKLLILDEPTSAIDAKAERSIFNSIMEKSANATVLIVSHRFATVRKADYIYVVDQGSIIEEGSHADLMALNGHYAELYNLQAQDFLQ
ncbi:ABC transporter ATP-binding protein [Candidatus Saccharibacteria bacterium]|nr:ABC transporter ATP-binding protein [Candidatus Saccharibacteria bacterium]MBP7834612.1 ABC transporter ATP-binding protein [Candidatus Saccharibacteria bacterium]